MTPSKKTLRTDRVSSYCGEKKTAQRERYEREDWQRKGRKVGKKPELTMRPEIRFTPPRRARRRMAGLVIPWMFYIGKEVDRSQYHAVRMSDNDRNKASS